MDSYSFGRFLDLILIEHVEEDIIRELLFYIQAIMTPINIGLLVSMYLLYFLLFFLDLITGILKHNGGFLRKNGKYIQQLQEYKEVTSGGTSEDPSIITSHKLRAGPLEKVMIGIMIFVLTLMCNVLNIWLYGGNTIGKYSPYVLSIPYIFFAVFLVAETLSIFENIAIISNKDTYSGKVIRVMCEMFKIFFSTVGKGIEFLFGKIIEKLKKLFEDEAQK